MSPPTLRLASLLYLGMSTTRRLPSFEESTVRPIPPEGVSYRRRKGGVGGL